MHIVSGYAGHGSRLRFVFSDTVLSFRIAADVTLGEIAYRCGEISDRLLSEPIAVDVTVDSHGDVLSRSWPDVSTSQSDLLSRPMPGRSRPRDG
jgi:hypothetical protein